MRDNSQRQLEFSARGTHFLSVATYIKEAFKIRYITGERKSRAFAGFLLKKDVKIEPV